MDRRVSPREPQPAAEVAHTLQALDSAVPDTSLASISGLGIAQVRNLKHQVASIFPASNLPAFVLSGLMQIRGHGLERDRVLADLRVLFRETQQIGLYSTFLVAPALIIHGYQALLALAGKDLASAFPDGTWQFYTEFGLREDAARHAVETTGFQRAAAHLAEADAAACWVAAAMQTLFCYEDLLANEWHERTALRSVELAIEAEATQRLGRRLPRKADERARAVAEAAATLRAELGLERLAADWSTRRTYAGPADRPLEGFAPARRAAFERFLETRLRGMPAALRAQATAHYDARRPGLPAYQAQLSLHRTLRADEYGERREPLPFEQLCVALRCGGRYFLIELCERDEAGSLLITPRDGDPARPGQPLPLFRDGAGHLTDRYGQPVRFDGRGEVHVAGLRVGRLRPTPLTTLRAQIAATLRASPPLAAEAERPGVDLLLATAPRARQGQLRELLGASASSQVEALRRAPIIVSWEQHRGAQPLGALRRAGRGCGDHAMTIMRADTGTVFDLSHIFFDGIWGAALAEIVTGFACALAASVPTTRPPRAEPPPALTLTAGPAFMRAAAAAAAERPAEAAAESAAVSLRAISTLRRRLAEREIELTVNDLLLLARWEHAASYRPGPVALAGLDDLASRGAEGAALRDTLMRQLEQARQLPPTLLIPMDASWLEPRARLHPAALRNPQPDLLPRLAQCETLLRSMRGDDTARVPFEAARTALVGDLLRFGAVLRALREVTTRGESFATASLRLLGHLPRPLQSLLDMIPQKIDLLNEIVKGTEVFSNIGQMAPGASLHRFMSSRDDGDTKQLIWGALSDSDGRLVVTLRDFRPHVGMLQHAGHQALAELLTADYLEAYAASANSLVKRLQQVLAAKSAHD